MTAKDFPNKVRRFLACFMTAKDFPNKVLQAAISLTYLKTPTSNENSQLIPASLALNGSKEYLCGLERKPGTKHLRQCLV